MVNSYSSILRCFKCGFEAPIDSAQWKKINHPPLGDLTQCPECGSTDIRGK